MVNKLKIIYRRIKFGGVFERPKGLTGLTLKMSTKGSYPFLLLAKQRTLKRNS
jgi:hypothetical protein